MRGRDDQIGAGVFRYRNGNPERLQLLGLVSGRIELQTKEGVREFATVVGPEELSRLVTLRRHYPRKRAPVYRDDIL